jgi:glutamate-1-semialdehyde 2,1-aminomutase
MTTLFEQAKSVIPGGVNSPVRAFKAVGGDPIFFERAEGPYLYSSAGKRYIDYVLSWGPMIAGHAHPDVIAAVTEKVKSGLSFGAPTEIETELASEVIKLMPSIEKIRFVSSGTEATMSAIRLARGYTGRDKIVKFEGCYHGHSDSLLIKAGSGALTFGVPSSPGVPASLAEHTITLEYNNINQVKKVFSEIGSEIACIIVEPVAGNMNCIPPIEGFLEALRSCCNQSGAVLIFDEVMTGFRLGPQGAQGYYGVQPDLTTLGKVVGGGMPVGAFGGSEDIMNFVAPVGPVYQAGTLSGNPVAMAAGLTTVKLIQTPGFYDTLFDNTKYLVEGIRGAAEKHNIPFSINYVGSMWGVFFTHEERVSNYKQVMSGDIDRFNRFFHYLLENGVYIAPACYEAAFMSTAHSRKDLDTTIGIVDSAFQAV